jgi:hypothetical protein
MTSREVGLPPSMKRMTSGSLPTSTKGSTSAAVNWRSTNRSVSKKMSIEAESQQMCSGWPATIFGRLPCDMPESCPAPQLLLLSGGHFEFVVDKRVDHVCRPHALVSAH